jgi:broad specificity phosphatase PhoE
MYLFLIRHGQATNNLACDHKTATPRRGEHELTSLGRQQVLAFARWVVRLQSPSENAQHAPTLATVDFPIRSNLYIDRLVVSPMLRALQSAEILHNVLGIPCEVMVNLHEWGGPSELDPIDPSRVSRGMNCQQLQVTFPFMCLPKSLTESGWWHTDTREDWKMCWQRAVQLVPVLQEMVTRGNVLILTHAWFANVLALLLNGHDNKPGWWETTWREIHHAGLCIWDLSVLPTMPVIWNCLDHLQPDLWTI